MSQYSFGQVSWESAAAAFGKKTNKTPPDKIILDSSPDFDGQNDVVMGGTEEEEDDVVPMDIDVTAIPEKFICCITLSVMQEPVIDLVDGKSFEREAIVQWLQTNNTSPWTKSPLSLANLRPNPKLREEIRAFREAHPGLDWDD